jgi:hypothetical protein
MITKEELMRMTKDVLTMITKDDNDDDQECVNNDELDVYGSFAENS